MEMNTSFVPLQMQHYSNRFSVLEPATTHPTRQPEANDVPGLRNKLLLVPSRSLQYICHAFMFRHLQRVCFSMLVDSNFPSSSLSV